LVVRRAIWRTGCSLGGFFVFNPYRYIYIYIYIRRTLRRRNTDGSLLLVGVTYDLSLHKNSSVLNQRFSEREEKVSRWLGMLFIEK
jgi:hypothetical protein